MKVKRKYNFYLKLIAIEKTNKTLRVLEYSKRKNARKKLIKEPPSGNEYENDSIGKD